jgi:hypothetical protein
MHGQQNIKEEIVRKMSYKSYNTVSRCSSSFEIKRTDIQHVSEFNNDISKKLL